MSRKKRDRNAITQQGPGNNPPALFASRTQIRQAPLPDPAELERYREVDPDLYRLIKSEFEANGTHRREMEKLGAADRKRLIGAVTRNDTLGLVSSVIFVVASLSIATYFIYVGKDIGALIGVLGLLPAVIGMFRNRRSVTAGGQQRE